MSGTRRAETAWPAVMAATLCGVVVAMNIGKLPIGCPTCAASGFGGMTGLADPKGSLLGLLVARSGK